LQAKMSLPQAGAAPTQEKPDRSFYPRSAGSDPCGFCSRGFLLLLSFLG